MGRVGYFVVIPTHDRPDELRDCVIAITTSIVDEVIIIDNNSYQQALEGDIFIEYQEHPPNISKMWNIGLDAVRDIAYPALDEWFVAILNDDAVVPTGWFETITIEMDKYGADAGCSDQFSIVHQPLLNRTSGSTDLFRRLCGYAHILRGSSGLRYDENLKWWYSDDDIDWRARERGGMLIVPGYPVVHKHPNGQMNARPELIEQTGRDREYFQKKWGRVPW